MKPILAELVNVILQRVAENGGVPPSVDGMRSWLMQQGYRKRDIEAAFKKLRPRLNAENAALPRTPGSVRQLSVYESCKLSPEARDALARLELFELIQPHERELLLDRLAQFEGEVGMEDLDYLLSWLTCSVRDVESQQTIYHVLEGNRQALH